MSVLPTRAKPVAPVRIGPKILIIYSLPKVGKTEALVELAEKQDCLILDGESGTQTYQTTAVQIGSIPEIHGVVKQIDAEGAARAQQGKTGMEMFPYKFLALDTLDKLEELAEWYATAKFKETTIGKNFKGASVLELPQGGGYYYLRMAMTEVVDMLASRCPYLILIVHVKEKIMLDKANTEVKVNDISLTGKLSSILCAKADAIGYMYRDNKGVKRISFNTYDGAVMGARQKYLAGKDMEFSWESIYPEVFGQTVPDGPSV